MAPEARGHLSGDGGGLFVPWSFCAFGSTLTVVDAYPGPA